MQSAHSLQGKGEGSTLLAAEAETMNFLYELVCDICTVFCLSDSNLDVKRQHLRENDLTSLGAS